MIRDLLDHAISIVRDEQARHVKERAEHATTERLIDLLLPSTESPGAEQAAPAPGGNTGYVAPDDSVERKQRLRDKLREQLTAGKLARSN